MKYKTPERLSKFSTRATLVVVFLLISKMGLSDERPRDITLILRTPTTVRYNLGQAPTDDFLRKIYFSPNGTIYATTDPKRNFGVMIPAGMRSNTYSYDQYVTLDGEGKTRTFNGWNSLSIDGKMEKMMLEFRGLDCTPTSFGQTCATYTQTVSLTISGTICKIIQGTVNFSNDNPYNKVVSVAPAGQNSCYIRPGRELNE